MEVERREIEWYQDVHSYRIGLLLLENGVGSEFADKPYTMARKSLEGTSTVTVTLADSSAIADSFDSNLGLSLFDKFGNVWCWTVRLDSPSEDGRLRTSSGMRKRHIGVRRSSWSSFIFARHLFSSMDSNEILEMGRAFGEMVKD